MNDDEGQLKTAPSARLVPIHPESVARGLLEYRAQLQTRAEARIWPDLSRSADGFYTSPFVVNIDKPEPVALTEEKHALALREVAAQDTGFVPALAENAVTQKWPPGGAPSLEELVLCAHFRSSPSPRSPECQERQQRQSRKRRG